MYVVAACLMRHLCEEELGIMILACHQISKSFGDVSIIENGSFHIEDREKAAIVGINGAGKSTLLKIITGELSADSGTVVLSKDKTLGYLAQHQECTSDQTIYDTLLEVKQDIIDLEKRLRELEASMKHADGEELSRLMDAYTRASHEFEQANGYAWKSEIVGVLKGLGFSEEDFGKQVSTLSGGQKQLLNLASIMAMQPEVLILDEPTSQLDPIAASDFLNTVRKINIELGTTILITEHRLEDIYHSADRVVVMEQGRVIANDTPRNVGQLLWQQENEMFAALPTPVRVFYQAVGEGACPLTVREGRSWLTKTFENRPLSVAEPEEEPALPAVKDPALKLKEVWFRYEREAPDVLQGVGFSVPRGKLFAIVGGNGAGKSTLLKTICGICKPYRGTVEIMGKPVKAYRQRELYQHCLAMLPQDPKSLFVKKTVREDLEEMCREEAKIAQVAETCQLLELLESHPYDLSGGEQQRAALAKVLLTQPKILLLDEPTKGLDSFFKVQFARILRKLMETGMTIVMVSHDVEFCAEYADTVSMFFDGQILTTNTPRRFFGQNSFYTTAANRMSRCVFRNAVTAADVTSLYQANMREES